jgi:hypothetical protein
MIWNEYNENIQKHSLNIITLIFFEFFFFNLTNFERGFLIIYLYNNILQQFYFKNQLSNEIFVK